MKNRMMYVICVILLVGLPIGLLADNSETNNAVSVTTETSALNKKVSAQSKNAVIALNYLHASLNKIAMYNDKRVLEEEYDNIINNINLTAINDKEIVDIITELMDTLSVFRLKEMEKERLQKNYEKKLDEMLNVVAMQASANVFTNINKNVSTIINKNIKAFDPALVTTAATATSVAALSATMMPVFAAVAAATTANSYMNIQTIRNESKEDIENADWELKKTAVVELNKIRKKFLVLYWSIMKRYSIPDEWRITEKQLKKFVKILKDKDEKKKYRQLSRMKDELSMLPTFWYELSLSAHSLGKKKQELAAIKAYENLNYKLLRKNAQYSLMLANEITYMDPATQRSKITALLKKIEKIDSNNPQRKLFMAMEYALIGDNQKAEELLDENIDDDFLTDISEKMKLKLFIKSNQIQEYKKTIGELLKEQKLSVYEKLSYLGEYPVESLVKEVKSEIEQIDIRIKGRLYGKDDLIVALPKKWVLKDVEDAKLFLIINNEEREYDSVDVEEDFLVYSFDKVFLEDDLKAKKIKHLKLKLVYKEVPTEITYSIKIEKPGSDEQNTLADNNESNASGFFKQLYKKSADAYAEYNSEIKFIPTTIKMGSTCFDILNHLKECKG